jgi:hypothetical protein
LTCALPIARITALYRSGRHVAILRVVPHRRHELVEAGDSRFWKCRDHGGAQAGDLLLRDYFEGRAIELLVAGGVLVETTGKKRDRSFVYQAYLDRLRAGTDLDEQGQQRERVRTSTTKMVGIHRVTLKKLAD